MQYKAQNGEFKPKNYLTIHVYRSKKQVLIHLGKKMKIFRK